MYVDDDANSPSRQEGARRIDLPDAELWLHDNVLLPEERTDVLAALLTETAWTQHQVSVYGRTLPAPRLSAWYGDSGAVYRYSGVLLEPLPWTQLLDSIKGRVEKTVGKRFNSVLLNLYRNGRDSVSWHSDNESALGREPVIASVSLGAVRRFALRHRHSGARMSLDLPSGSVLVMAGTMQDCWAHQVPKTGAAVGPRINLTFRSVKTAA